MKESAIQRATRVQIILFMTFIKLIGRLIALTSRVFTTSGMNIRVTDWHMTLVMVPNMPHMVVGTMSKLKI
jgi:hypothetical protein